MTAIRLRMTAIRLRMTATERSRKREELIDHLGAELIVFFERTLKDALEVEERSLLLCFCTYAFHSFYLKNPSQLCPNCLDVVNWSIPEFIPTLLLIFRV